MKYMIVSQPKSGTYLLANLLQSMNLKFSHIHVDEEDKYRVYKQNDLNNFEEYFCSTENIVNILQDNSFAVSHLECNEKNIKALSGMKKILITRDLDSIKKSAQMFFEEAGVDVSPLISKDKLVKMKKWSKQKNVFNITFEDIVDFNTESVDSLQKFLFNEVIYDSYTSIYLALKSDSLTKSSIRKY